MHNQDIKKNLFLAFYPFDSLLVESFTEGASSNHLEESKGQTLEEKELMPGS